ncbi:MAG: GDP-mannose 4,6-dehydratase [Gemmatimonadaceae bacterium]
MSRRVLITGGAGFVGQWLSRAMLQRGWKVFAGTVDGPPSGAVLSDEEKRAVCWTPLDVVSDESVAAAVSLSSPDWVVHLAGIAFAPEANASPVRAFEINALGAMRLLGALQGSAARVLVVGSAEEYGAQEASSYPISESAALRPLTPYAAAKAAQELIALQIQRSAGLDVICTRSFNHSGVGHGDRYLVPTLVRRVRELPRAGGALRIGNGDVIRDYSHVADVVNAYLLLLERGKQGEVYNVCSGKGMRVREIAERVLKRAGVSAEISSDTALLRPIDVPILIGENSKLRATGWEPTRTIDDIIDDLIHAATP